MEEFRKIYWPAVNLIGSGAVYEVAGELKGMGVKKPLIVTDRGVVRCGIVDKVCATLENEDIPYAVFDQVKENPTVDNCNEGLKVYEKNNCDAILSIGGGSPQDCAKAVGILATNGGDITDYEGVGKSRNRSVPIVAINTTAGTASEVTINYVITDEERDIKMVMADPNCLATVSVNDPLLMVSKPQDLTAATGMDALTHAVEAYITKGAFRFSDVLALESIKLIGESLERAVDDGEDVEARSKMAWASYIAGLSFSNAGLGIVHSMAHQLGSEYNLPHGVANAMLLPHVMAYNIHSCSEKMKDVAVALGCPKSYDEIDDDTVIDTLMSLSKRLGIPQGLHEVGVKEEDIEKLAGQAMDDICTGGNPREVSREDMVEIYRSAL